MAQTLVYVPIPCPSGKHAQSLVTLRNYATAAMFCIDCEQAWTEETSHPALRALPVTVIPVSNPVAHAASEKLNDS